MLHKQIHLSAPISRLAALLLTAAAVGAVYYLLAAPLFDRYQQAHDNLWTQRQLLGWLAHVAELPARSSDVAAPGRGLFLDGESDAVMAAALQSTLRATGDAQGWRLVSTRVLPPRQDAGLKLIGIEGRLSTTLRALQRTLLALETARPVIVVTVVQVTPASAPITDASDPNGEQELSVRLELYGASAAPDGQRLPAERNAREHGNGAR